MTIEELQASLLKRVSKWFVSLTIRPGWTALVEDLHKQLLEIDPNYVLFQVKEKFGGLRFDAEPADTSIDIKMFYRIISKTEAESLATCDVCGGAGKTTKDGWWKTRCAEHND